MGQSGVTLGLVLYEDLDLVRRLFKGTISDEDIARRTSAVSMTYGEPFELAAKDLDAVEQHGWPIAGPEAYPFVMRVNPGQAVRVPLRWEVALLTGCLEVIPQFINEERTAQVYTTSSTVEPLTLKLTLLEDDTPAD